jgi:hypothetical protein
VCVCVCVCVCVRACANTRTFCMSFDATTFVYYTNFIRVSEITYKITLFGALAV